MFTDICGFTQQTGIMSRSELMQSLALHNALLTPIIQGFGGTIVKSIGDAFLITFESTTNALHCGLCLQHALSVHNRSTAEAQHIRIKVSVNCGEVALTDTDVFGDPVNVAAKIEKVTEPSQVYFTEAVFLAMNQAEVPCEFVTMFAAKGESNPEIKLYRLLMDEKQAEYGRIVELGMARTAAHTAAHNAVVNLGASGSDALERNASVLNSANTSSPRVSSASQSILAKVFGLRVYSLLGSGKAIGMYAGAAVLMSVGVFWVAHHSPVGKASLLLGSTSQPSVVAAEGTVPSTSAATSTTTSVPALPESSPLANSPVILPGPPQAVDPKFAGILAWADNLLKNPEQLKEQSNTIIEKLSLEFGNNADKQQVQAALLLALKSRVYWEARDVSFDAAGTLLTSYRNRFLWVTDWSFIERERYLGGLHNYATDNKIRRDWLSFWSDRWQKQYAFLKAAADADPDFGLRVAIELSDINQRLNRVAAPQEQILVREALSQKPQLLQTQRRALVSLVQTWLQFEQADNSYARELARQHLYADLRPWLTKHLMANQAVGVGGKAAYAWRQNCFSLLAGKNDLDAIGNPWVYIKNNPEVFLRVSETVQLANGAKRTEVFIRPEYVQRLLQRPLPEDDKSALAQWLGSLQQDIGVGQGPWAHHEGSLAMVLAMQETIGFANPMP